MDAFILLDIEDSCNGEMKPRVSNVAVEITRGCRMGHDVSNICNIIEQVQVGRTVMFCSKSEDNAYKRITRQIRCIIEIYWRQ